ncbi:MAG: hypothetical protein BWY69_01470 [Planctomycetes bacterium ADurb.Bin401]|nr:MAG: hypothetical protein BWY69_01470 [Planctomycetes bacterium ADurb.Bin401]
MIKEETVFILGAGASVPYGFPTAMNLRTKICSDNSFAHVYIKNMYFASEGQKSLLISEDKKFRHKFADSEVKSIDSFLAINKDNQSFNKIGKLSIGYHILNFEASSKLTNNWLQTLYNKMLEGLITSNGFKKFNLNKISFITFNYDRTLEQFFLKALSNTFSHAPYDEIVQIVNTLPIHHVYGSISSLPWQNADGIAYGQEPDTNTMNIAANNLKTIYEINNNENDDLELSDAITWIKNAKKVFVLGFGYDPENVKILDIPDSIPLHTDVFGTAFGLELGQIEKAKECFFLPKRNTNRIKIMDTHADCLKLLNNCL